MRVILAGGSGFLGQMLGARLAADGHTVQVLTRHPRPGVPGDLGWRADGSGGDWVDAIDGADAIVNLAGAGIADRRWSAARKQALIDSRMRPTASLVGAIRQASTPPALISSSAVGYYGARGDERIPEGTAPSDDFLARLCRDWEATAMEAATATRVVLLRTGLVLDPNGGALGSMLLPFKLGVGGRLGSGEQYWPWIHIADWLAMTTWLIGESRASGAFNLTAPEPVTNLRFTRALGAALHRPAVLPAPAFALRLALGEFARFLVTGQRAVPDHAEALGFAFRFRDVETALADLVQ